MSSIIWQEIPIFAVSILVEQQEAFFIYESNSYRTHDQMHTMERRIYIQNQTYIDFWKITCIKTYKV